MVMIRQTCYLCGKDVEEIFLGACDICDDVRVMYENMYRYAELTFNEFYKKITGKNRRGYENEIFEDIS